MGAAACCGADALADGAGGDHSDTGAAVLVWPKIVVDHARDTVIKITNQSNAAGRGALLLRQREPPLRQHRRRLRRARWTASNERRSRHCEPGWIEINFDIILTRDQPLAWSARGLASILGRPWRQSCPASRGRQGAAARATRSSSHTCIPPETNAGTRIPPVGESPFIGELKCIQVDPLTASRACRPTVPERRPAAAPTRRRGDDHRGRARTDRSRRSYNAVGMRTDRRATTATAPW